MTASFDPFEAGFFENPYPQYARVRVDDPIHRSSLGPWMLFRHEDSSRVLREPGTSVDASRTRRRDSERNELLASVLGDRVHRGSRSILNVDPPDHTRLRRLVQQAFTPRMVAALRPRAEAIADELLTRVDGPEVDVIASLAFPLPFTVICDLLGMPVGETRDEVRAWSHTLAGALDPILNEQQVRAIAAASDAMGDHVAEVLAAKRAGPADDLLTALLHAEEDGDVLSPEELVDQVVLLFIAGHETTVNLIGNGVFALLQHPDQLARLRAEPDLLPNAVDELLRWDSPVQLSRRVLLVDMTFGDVTLPADSFVITVLGAANRDPAKWGDDAERLDLGRAGAAQHLSFGAGIHHCLGASLARVEGQVAIGSLLNRFSHLELASDTPAWNGRVLLRGLDELPVRVA
jgi:cytochrome P450